MAHKLRILAVFAMIIASTPLQISAAEQSVEVQDIYDQSQTHCLLLQRAPLTPQPRYMQRLQDAQVDDQSFSLIKQYEYAPDFGFLIPNYWATLSWVQRVRFNHTLTAYVKNQLDIPQQNTTETDCQPDIRVIEGTEDNAKKRSYSAIAIMNLRDEEGKALPISYLYEKPVGERWQLEDIILYNSSLKDKNRAVLHDAIRTQGLDKLEAHLEKLTNKR